MSLLNSGCKIYDNIIKNKLHTYDKNKIGEELGGFIMYVKEIKKVSAIYV
jgi:hypothetical protein